jgi:hypothetical protein
VSSILATRQYILWNDPQDNPALLEAIQRGLFASMPKPLKAGELERDTGAELRRLAMRSEAMAGELRNTLSKLTADPSPTASQLHRIAGEAADVMLQEAFDWRIQYRMQELKLP